MDLAGQGAARELTGFHAGRRLDVPTEQDVDLAQTRQSEKCPGPGVHRLRDQHRRRAQRALPAALRSRGRAQDQRLADGRSEEHTSELQSLMRISYDVFCLKKKKKTLNQT